MSETLSVILLLLMYVFTGGACIWFGIDHFINKRYFRFGIQVMFLISFVIFMVKIIFTQQGG